MVWNPGQTWVEVRDNTTGLPADVAAMSTDPLDKKKNQAPGRPYIDQVSGKRANDKSGAPADMTGGSGTPIGGDSAPGKLIMDGVNDLLKPPSNGIGDRPAITPPANVVIPQMGWTNPGPADPRRALIDQKAQAEFRLGQQNLIGQLAMQASGRGPSVAGAQLQQASQANQAATFAQLASARGGVNGAGLARNAMNTSANIQAQTSRDAAVARMQEQMNAQQGLAGVLNQARGADIGMATSQAGLDSQRNLASHSAQVAMAQQFNDLKAKYAMMGLDAQKANQMAALDIQRMMQNNFLADADRANAQQAASRAQMGQYATAAGGVLGTVVGGPAGGAVGATAGNAAVQQSNYSAPTAPQGATTTGGPNGSSTKPGITYA